MARGSPSSDHQLDHDIDDDIEGPGKRLRVLGEPRLITDDGAQTPIAGTGALVLASLISARGAIVSVDRLLEDVWMGHAGDGTVRTSISRLRGVLGPARDAIVHTSGGYRFDHDRLATDVIEFEQVLRAATAAGFDDRGWREALTTALHRCGGRLFDGLEASFLDRDRDQFLQLRLRTVEQLAGGDDARLDGDDIDEIVRLADDHPERESLVLVAARALGRSGRMPSALRLCARHRKVVWEHWGVVPSKAFDAVERTLLGDPVPGRDEQWRASVPTGSSGPQGSTECAPRSLLGRQVEMATLARLLSSRRVVSIVGFGGVGKTHLAREVARSSPAERAVFVDLAHTRSDDSVETTILEAFGLGHGEIAAPVEIKISQVVDGPTLVILDNCEQVASFVREFIERLVSSAPDVTVLATSRSPLGLAAEYVFPLASLPTRSDFDGPQGSSSPSLDLLRTLVEHVDWEADAEIGEDLVEAVGGLPLAVVFLARMLTSLSPSELHAALDDGGSIAAFEEVDGVAIEIRRVADSALERLDPSTRQLFATLSCVPGRFDLALATAMSPNVEPVATVANRLRSLVEVGFVERHPRGSGLRMTALLRSYAASIVDEHERRRAVTAMWRQLADMAVAQDQRTRGADQVRGLQVLEGHWPLVNELLTADIADEHLADAWTIAASMGSFWFLSGRWAEGPSLIRRLLADPRLDDVGRRGRLVAAMIECTGTYAATAAQLPLLEQTIVDLEPVATDRQDLHVLATCHTYATSSSIWLGDVDGFGRHLAEAERLIAAHDFTSLAGWITMFLGLRLRNDDRAEMRRLLHQARSHYLELGDRGRAATVMLNLGMVMARHGELQMAEVTLRDCLDLTDGLNMRSLDAHARSQLAQIAVRKGSPEAADDLVASRTAFVEMGDIGCLSVCNRLLAELASSAGEDDAALRWLRDSLDSIATVDQQEFALTLVEIAAIYMTRGRNADAAVICAVARESATGAGIGISDEQRQRIGDLSRVLADVTPDRELAIALAMT